MFIKFLKGIKMNQVNLGNINEYTFNLLQALREYKDRQKDKSKIEQLGHFLKNESGKNVWIPFSKEICRCCTSNYGNKISGRNLKDHLSSATHIATFYNVNRSDLIKLSFMFNQMKIGNAENMLNVISNMGSIYR